jgi:hypothetical protein
MPINIKSQKDCLTTKVAISLPVDLNALDQLMRVSKATGHIVATYNQGGMLGVNIEQNKTITDKLSGQVREIVGIGTKELDCE